jgi:hypothetical protein
MKTIFTAFTFFLLCVDYTTAQTKLPDTFINVGVGIGANYGSLGTKTVLGFKNSGLMVGLGRGIDGYPAYQIGGQISYKWAYTSFGYGGLFRQRGQGHEPIPNEAILTFGAMISLGKSKRSFIDLGIGQYLSAYTKSETWATYGWAASLTPAVGFGYRLGNKKNVFD